MASFFFHFLKRVRHLKRSTLIWGGIGVVVVAGIAFLAWPKAPHREYVAVTQGAITETVSVTGNSTPTKSVSLGFASGGVVAHAYADVGTQVSAGTVLATLNVNDLSAQLKQAQANVDVAKANLAGLEAGAQPQDIAAAQAAYDKAEQDLANMYSSVPDTAADSYAKANDAVRSQLTALISNAETNQPGLTFSTSDSQAKLDAMNGRVAAGAALNDWQTELSALASVSDEGTLDAAIQKERARLASIQSFLASMNTVVNSATNLDASTLATYKTDVATAISDVNTASKNLNTLAQNIASQKLTAEQLQAQLNLKKAGSTPQAIAADQAQVEAAQANADSIAAKLANSEIVAPINGVITQFDAKVGQSVGAASPLVSIISGSAFEVDADVPETDIGKIAVGDPVSMTFDAFPGETFTGHVFYIDPAQTVLQGVVDYKVKVSFDKPDPRMKSGLTANLDIATAHKDNVLILPEYAILENDSGNFVETLENGKVVQHPVTLGLQDEKGNVEVTSGVSAGEQVLNIGLKQQ